MTDTIFFDPKPLVDLLGGYLRDFESDIHGTRRSYKMLATKKEWTHSELETFRMSIIDVLKHIEKELEELEAEAGVKIPR